MYIGDKQVVILRGLAEGGQVKFRSGPCGGCYLKVGEGALQAISFESVHGLYTRRLVSYRRDVSWTYAEMTDAGRDALKAYEAKAAK